MTKATNAKRLHWPCALNGDRILFEQLNCWVSAMGNWSYSCMWWTTSTRSNNYQNKIGIFVVLKFKDYEMEELKRVRELRVDESSRRRLIEYQDTTNEFTARIQELQNEINCTTDSVAILAQETLLFRTCSFFPVHERFSFCFVQVSTTQLYRFPPVLMARARDGTDVPVSPLPSSSSNMGSPYGSFPDIKGTRNHASTMEE